MSILNVSLFLMLYVATVRRDRPDRLASAWGLISASFAGGMAVGGLGLMLVQLRRPMVFVSC